MGVIKRGILGGFSGKVGNIVGSSWKGIAVMKSMPLSVANPRTTGQVNQRNAFSTIVSYASLLLTYVVKPCWDRFAQGQSGFNEFISTNIEYVNNLGLRDPLLFKISKGKLESTQFASLIVDATTGIAEIIYNDSIGTGNALPTDVVKAVLYNRQLRELAFTTIPSSRADLSVIINVPSNWVVGNTVFAYLAFVRADGTLASNTFTIFSVII